MLPGYKFKRAMVTKIMKCVLKQLLNFFNNEKRGNSTPTFTFDHAKKGTVLLDSYVTAGALVMDITEYLKI
jgi:hypothetical protein